jgi:hypothetical protein
MGKTNFAIAENDSPWLIAHEALSRLARERATADAEEGRWLRQVEELVAGRRRGDSPSAPADPWAQRHVLRFEVSAETFALFREARSELRRRSDAPIDEDTVLLEMSRLVLCGPRDEGRSSYQVSLHVCSECGRGQLAASGQLVARGTGSAAPVAPASSIEPRAFPRYEHAERSRVRLPYGEAAAILVIGVLALP